MREVFLLCVGPVGHALNGLEMGGATIEGIGSFWCGVQVHNKVSAVVRMVDLVYVRRKANRGFGGGGGTGDGTGFGGGGDGDAN